MATTCTEDGHRLPKQALQYKPTERRNIGRPRKRWRDQLHLEDQGTENVPNPSGTWWWWWWWWWWDKSYRLVSLVETWQQNCDCTTSMSYIFRSPIPVAVQSKAWVCGHSHARLAGSNPLRVMDVCLFWLLCVVKKNSLRWAEYSSRRVLLCMVCPLSVKARPRNGRSWPGSWSKRHKKKIVTINISNGFSQCKARKYGQGTKNWDSTQIIFLYEFSGFINKYSYTTYTAW